MALESLKNGTAVLLREPTMDDLERSRRFFLSLSPEDRRYLRVDVTRPEVVLSTFMDINCLLSLTRTWLFPRSKLVIRESVSPIGYLPEKRFSRLRLWLYRHSYPRANAIIALSPSLHREIEQVCLKPLPQLRVITNPSPVVPRVGRRRGDGEPRRLISIGRLDRQKGYDLLLHAVAELTHRHPQISLVLVGRGPEEPTLKELASSLGISDCVSFIGCTATPLDLLSQADIYVLSSRYEGVSNAMLEALALDLPVVATTEHTSAADFIEDGVNGVLVRETGSDALAAAIDRAIALCRSNSWSFVHKPHTEEEMLKEFGKLLERLSVSEDSTVSTGENA